MSFVVAIDGPAAAGKGTISRAVAKEFGFAHLDTGLLYRAVGKRALNMGRGVIDEGVAELCARELTEKDVVDEGLRTVLVSRAASRVAALPGVRSALLDFQHRFAAREGGALRREVPLWLNRPAVRAMVVSFTCAQPKDGGEGALYVLLKRKRP